MQFSFFRAHGAVRTLLLAAVSAVAGFGLGWGLSAGPLALCRAEDLTAVPDTRFLEAVAAQQDTNVSGEDTAARRVCLTFDDGPSKTTPAVLQALAAENVSATFFVVANESNEKRLPLIQQAQQAGHEIALHSASHKYSDIYRSTDAFWNDIDLLRERLAPYADTSAIRCLRFPGGSTNTVSRKYGGSGIMAELKTQAEQRGWRWVDWNVCAEDAAGEKLSASEVYYNVTHGSEGLDRCIVLMHDSATTGTTAEALPDIIRWYKDNGYTFCTISQLYDELA
ncbi:xylanase/chitin deacetylase [Faecalibacterium sp. An77]|uniref:polysaccharide deacetylase family protein n=1 Tax=Faecalibacterium sp. An77 TaxID=1965655 RepID=UPI000B3AF961|nr:polysaccharide deacetylase family protein [Faecalibacterium sp. An77]OUN35523.1 xylanase/chitin deacetylase [Faecalibacterium sp. An77]